MRNHVLNALAAVVIVLAASIQASATPIPTANQTLWFRADDGVTKDGSNFVSSWGDQAPLNGANNATQASGTLQPLWVDNQLNGHAVIRFDGSGDYLENTSYAQGTSSASLFVVAKLNGAPATYHNIFMQNATYGNPAGTIHQMYADSSGNLFGNYQTASLDINTSTTLSSSNFTLLHSQKDASGGGSSQFFINGNSAGTPGTGSQVISNNFYIGAWNARSLNGDIAEIIMYNAPLSQSDRELVEGSLAWKYGLQSSLPVSHPYFNLNPNLEPVVEVPVPEPATLGMLGLGLLAMLRKRQRNARG